MDTPEKLPLIIWDIDDVLNDLMYLCINSTAQKINPGTRYSLLRHNPPLEELGCTREVFTQQLDICRQQVTDSMLPRTETLQFFQDYGHLFRSIALSAAPITLAPLSSAWVLKHFGRWIHGTIFVPSPRKNVPIAPPCFRSKAEAVLTLQGILIDDSPQNVEAVLAAGGKAEYFPAPWNKNRDISFAAFFQSLAERLF